MSTGRWVGAIVLRAHHKFPAIGAAGVHSSTTSLHADESFVALGGDFRRREAYA
jgi:hypothetical protein